ncbi:zinc finger protein OZF [Nothobranchius furzeri]|uniref:Zinc finger protein OZF-like n=6 Tax=Nothobranchius TaxID=28779 RepID=A0A9D2XQR5_NOTFU|nr:zinc finger protein OZF-like [Nothobranchius furzeri]
MSNKIQDDVYNPRDQLRIIVVPADGQEMVLIKEEASGCWSPSVNQEDSKPFYIKEEQDESWTDLEEEQPDVEETDAVSLKSENDEEKRSFSEVCEHQLEDGDLPTSSSVDQTTATVDGEDCGGAETSRYPDCSNSSETEVSEADEHESCSDSQLNFLPQSKSKTKGSERKESRSCKSSVKKSFICSDCGKQFVNTRSLQRHMKRHSKITSSNCLVDDKSLKVEEKVDSPKKVQTSQKSFSCDFCGKIFNRKDNLNTHVRIHTGQKPFGCDVCERRFGSKTHLNRHMIIHIGEKPFVCDVCGQRFSDKSNLNGHMRKHTGQKPFGCDICGQRISDRSSLSRHMKIHTGLKPFGCDVCERRFSSKTHLNTHMRIHTGQKPFACNICGQRFIQKPHLNTHMIIHTDDKPFSCDVCGQRFSYKSNLKRHIRIHTGNKTNVQ